MKNGIAKRGSTYSYVVRIPDPKTGKTKPHWVSGFKTEIEAKMLATRLELRQRMELIYPRQKSY